MYDYTITLREMHNSSEELNDFTQRINSSIGIIMHTKNHKCKFRKFYVNVIFAEVAFRKFAIRL